MRISSYSLPLSQPFFHSLVAKKIKQLSDEALALIARRFAILSEPMRLRILQQLMSKPMPVNGLVEATGGTQTNVSRHLQTLAHAGMVTRRKEGLQAFYSIADPTIIPLCEMVCGSIEQQLTTHSAHLRAKG